MNTVTKQFTVIDPGGTSQVAVGYSQASQLAADVLKDKDVAVIVIRIEKVKRETQQC
jgi:hypothetical protein